MSLLLMEQMITMLPAALINDNKDVDNNDDGCGREDGDSEVDDADYNGNCGDNDDDDKRENYYNGDKVVTNVLIVTVVLRTM